MIILKSKIQLTASCSMMLSSVIVLIISESRVFCKPKPEGGYHDEFAHEKDPEVLPSYSKTTSVFIFIHGLQPTEQDTSKVWKTILSNHQRPYMKIICPSPYFMPGEDGKRGMLRYYTGSAIHGMRIYNVGPIKYIQDLIDKEIEAGVPPERIILGGSKQGGALALHSAITFSKRLAGVVLIGTHLTGECQKDVVSANIPVNRDIPILQCDRKIVSEHYLRGTNAALREISAKLEPRWHAESNDLLPTEAAKSLDYFVDKIVSPTS